MSPNVTTCQLKKEAQKGEGITPGLMARVLDGGFSKVRVTALLPGAFSLQTLGPDEGPSDPMCIHNLRIKVHLPPSEMESHLL